MKTFTLLIITMLVASASVSAALVNEESHPSLFVSPPKNKPLVIDLLVNPKYSREAAVHERYEELRKEHERNVVEELAIERYKKAECKKSKNGTWTHPELNVVLTCKSYEEQRQETEKLLRDTVRGR